MGIQINTQPQTFSSPSTVLGSTGLSAVAGLTVYGNISASGTVYGLNNTLAKNQMTGSGGTTYTLATYPSQNAEDYIVAVDGVIQTAGSSYSVSGSSLIFTAAIPSGSEIVALVSRGITANSTNVPSFKKNEFTTTTSATYTLSYYSNNNAENYLVFLDGVMQSPTTDYTISGSTITLIPAPASGVKLVVMSLQNADGTYATTAAVDITGKIDKPASPSAGQVLTYNGSTSTWVASAAPSGGVSGNVQAWVNFNGTGTVTIKASTNITSITDNATGQYILNFTTYLVDANYAVVAMARKNSDAGTSSLPDTGHRLSSVKTVSSCEIVTQVTTSYADVDDISVIVVR